MLKIVFVSEIEMNEGEYVQTVQNLRIRLLSGPYKGEELITENYLTSDAIYDIRVKEGDRIIVNLEVLDDGSLSAHIIDYSRESSFSYCLYCYC